MQALIGLEDWLEITSGAPNEMKRLYLLALIVPLLLLVDYSLTKDVPTYTVDRVLQVAKDFSPECRVRKDVERDSP